MVTPEHPDADDCRFSFPVARYPSVDTRKLFGYLAGYPFSPETLRQLKEQKVDLLHSHCPVMSTILARSIREVIDAPLVFTYHTKFDVDVAKLIRGKLLQESALYLLASNPGRVFSTDEIFEKVWNEKVYEANNTVMVHIRRLRGKMKEDTRENKIITTVWGVGYKIEK